MTVTKIKRPPKNKPLWDLYRDGISQGAIQLFLACREQFRLQMVEGLSYKGTSFPLEFGSAFHHCLAEVHTNKAWDSKEALRNYFRIHKAGAALKHSERAEIDFTLKQVAAVADKYFIFWKKHDKGKKWVAREVVFKTDHPIPLTGRWDGIYRNKEDGRLWLHETKTKEYIDEEFIRLSLPFDTQTMLYCFAAECHFNEPVGGVLYDVARRPRLRQKKTESKGDFTSRIEEDISIRPKEYFMRWEVTLQKNDVRKWVDNQLRPILTQIEHWQQNPELHHYMNPGSLMRYNRKCDMFYVITRGNYWNTYRRRYVYPELVD